jgi:hypothetical protein
MSSVRRSRKVRLRHVEVRKLAERKTLSEAIDDHHTLAHEKTKQEEVAEHWKVLAEVWRQGLRSTKYDELIDMCRQRGYDPLTGTSLPTFRTLVETLIVLRLAELDESVPSIE